MNGRKYRIVINHPHRPALYSLEKKVHLWGIFKYWNIVEISDNLPQLELLKEELENGRI